jgi:hypothetical protein
MSKCILCTHVRIYVIGKRFIANSWRAMKDVLECSTCRESQFQVNTLNSTYGGAQAVPDQSDVGDLIVGKHLIHCREDRCSTRCLSGCESG